MNAVEFVKKYGVNEAKRYSKMIGLSVVEGVSVKDLKQIVDAFELVETGLPELKKAMFSNSKDLDYVKNWILTVSDKLLTEKGARLKQAINLVEQCQ